jgi:hypothetical protein
MSNAKAYNDWEIGNTAGKISSILDTMGEAYYSKGVLEERERILEMLTNSMSNGTSRGMRRAIKLIEGLDE